MNKISLFRRVRLAVKRVLLMSALKRHRMETYARILDAPPYWIAAGALADEQFFDVWKANVLDSIERNMTTARYWAETNTTMVHGGMTDWEILTHDPHYISAIFAANRELRDKLALYTQIHLDVIGLLAKECRTAFVRRGSGLLM